jgi:signal peptide peptidase SppA
MSDVTQWITTHPWAIKPEMLQTIIAIANRESAYEDMRKAVSVKDGDPLAGTRRAEVRDRVAIIPVMGPIFPRANLFTAFSGATSVQTIAKDFNVALGSSDIDAILFNYSTPGGAVEGLNEFSAMIRNARNIKPIYSYVGGEAASAGYWLASAGSRIIADKTSILGSIGIVMAVEDSRAKDEKSGVKRYEIVSSNAPNKRPDVATDQGRAQIQKIIDATEAVFLGEVAENRGVSVETVLKAYGQGGVFVGQAAIDAGLADEIGSFEKTLAMLSKKKNSTYQGGFMNLKELQANHPETYQAALAEGVENGKKIGFADGKAQGIAEGKTAGIEEGKKIGVSEERTRIQNIEALKVLPGAESVIAENKFKDGMTADAIAGLAYNAVAQKSASAVSAVAADAQALGKKADAVANGAPANAAAEEDKFIAAVEKIGEERRKSAGK